MSHKTDAAPQEAPGASPLKRRSLFAGAGALGALAATAAVLPVVQQSPAPVAKAQPVDPEGGYQVTEHVERYYQTARV